MKYVGITALILVSLIAIIGLSVGGEYLNLWWRQTFEPAHEDIDREVWENTNSRINGAVQEINERMIEYNSAESIEEKKAIAQYIRGSYPDLDPNKINDEVIRNFYKKVKYGNY